MNETENRTATIQFRVTPEEYNIISEAANAEYVKIGTFVRVTTLRSIAQNATKMAQGEVAVSEQTQS